MTSLSTTTTNGVHGASTKTTPADAPVQKKRYNGKEYKWGVLPATRFNDGLLPNLPIFFFVGATILFNKSSYGPRFYEWLNANFTNRQINIYWTLGVTTGSYWLVGLIFMAFDLIDPLHKLVKKYKLQPDVRITGAQYRQVMKIAFRNLLCVNIPLTVAMAYIYPLRTVLPLPGAWTCFWQYFVCLACEEIGFYTVHRICHSKLLYKRVHKLHHQFTAPVALASTYCTMTEHIFSNLSPIITPFYIFNVHWCVSMMFFASLQMGTLCTHSDYNIPGLFNALQHDWHHFSYTENYGPVGILDALLGTDTNFQVWLRELKLRDQEDWLRNGRVELASKSQ